MYSSLVSLLNFKTLEQGRYSVLLSQGPFELRFYQRMICAQMSLTGPYDEVFNIGTKYLQEYFDGNNFKVEKIENSGCFFQVKKENSWDLGIILPSSSSINNAPKPINRMIRIIGLPPAKVASLSFKGHQSREIFSRRGEELKRWIDYKGFSIKGPLRIMKVSTSSLPFLRNYEVQYEIF